MLFRVLSLCPDVSRLCRDETCRVPGLVLPTQVLPVPFTAVLSSGRVGPECLREGPSRRLPGRYEELSCGACTEVHLHEREDLSVCGPRGSSEP